VGVWAKNCWTCQFDITREQDWQKALAGFVERNGRLDLLVNNAGILNSGPFMVNPLARHHAVVDVNVKEC
jgi:NAD(P)-dependent dehydrogenase (short-subunit alcohol dehydrogenase family)